MSSPLARKIKRNCLTLEVSDLCNEEDEDEDFQGPDDKDVDDSSLPNAFDRLRVSGSRSFNSVNFSN